MPKSNPASRKSPAGANKSRRSLPPNVVRLVDAVFKEDDDPRAHKNCEEALLQFVQDEVGGKPVAKLYPDVKHHLDRCKRCSAKYVALLDVELAAANNELPELKTSRPFDLSFLPPLRKRSKPLGRRAEEWLESLKAQLSGLVLVPNVALVRVQALSDDEEIKKGQTKDGSFGWEIVQRQDRNIAIHFGSSRMELEGARIRLKAGKWHQEVTLTRKGRNQVGADVVLPRAAFARDAKKSDIPLEIEMIDTDEG
jgi:hypothetical protein